MRYFNPKFYLDFDAEPHRYPSTPLDLTVLRTSFEKAVIKRLMSDVPFGGCGASLMQNWSEKGKFESKHVRFNV